jgi:hypothetical protein
MADFLPQSGFIQMSHACDVQDREKKQGRGDEDERHRTRRPFAPPDPGPDRRAGDRCLCRPSADHPERGTGQQRFQWVERLQRVEQFQQLQRLQRVERCQRAERCQHAERVERNVQPLGLLGPDG